jgi:Na+/H+-dicarboxylate symporter
MKKKFPLHWKIIIGLFAGIIWAILSSYFGFSEFTLNWIDPFGQIFLNLLKLIAVPLVLFSIIKGVSGLSDVSTLGKLGIKTLSLYLFTTVFAVSLGLLLVNVIKPGNFISKEQRIENRKKYELFVAAKDGVEIIDTKQILPDSTLSNISEQSKTNSANNKFSEKIKAAENTKDRKPLQFLIDMVPDNIFYALNNNTLMLQVIFFGIFFGITLLLIDSGKAKPVIDFIDGSNEVFLKMVDIVMNAAPFFVFALLAGKISEIAGDEPSNVINIFYGLGWYCLTVVLGLAIILFIVYPLIAKFFNRNFSYSQFFKAMAPAQMLAFSTSSSAATLPVTIECVEEGLKIPKTVTGFVLPIGATVNMDGTSFYQAVAVVFLAQFHLIDLTLGQQLTIILTATLASIGSAAVPSAGLVMLIIVLESVGLDPTWIAIIFPVDRILDMCRTVINVTGDATVATAVARMES